MAFIPSGLQGHSTFNHINKHADLAKRYNSLVNTMLNNSSTRSINLEIDRSIFHSISPQLTECLVPKLSAVALFLGLTDSCPSICSFHSPSVTVYQKQRRCSQYLTIILERRNVSLPPDYSTRLQYLSLYVYF